MWLARGIISSDNGISSCLSVALGGGRGQTLQEETPHVPPPTGVTLTVQQLVTCGRDIKHHSRLKLCQITAILHQHLATEKSLLCSYGRALWVCYGGEAP